MLPTARRFADLPSGSDGGLQLFRKRLRFSSIALSSSVWEVA